MKRETRAILGLVCIGVTLHAARARAEGEPAAPTPAGDAPAAPAAEEAPAPAVEPPVGPATSWPTFHGDYACSGLAGGDLPVPMARVWRTKLGAAVRQPPVSDGQRFFCATDDGDIVALDLKGNKLWTAAVKGAPPVEGGEPAKESIDAPLLAAGDRVIAVTGAGLAAAFDAAKGEERWRYDAGDHVQGSPTYDTAGGTVVVLTQPEGILHGIALDKGARRWVSEPAARCDGSPAAMKGKIVFGSCAAGFHVVNAATGKEQSFIGLGEGNEMAGGLALAGDQAFSGNRSGALACADLKAGEVLWTNEGGGGELFTTPAVGSDRVVFCGGDGSVYCVSRKTGEKIWTHETTGSIPGSPVIVGDKVLAPMDGTLHLLSLKDGAELWKGEVGDQVTSPAVLGALVVVGADDGYVTAFGAARP